MDRIGGRTVVGDGVVVRRLPVTSSLIYLTLGLALGFAWSMAFLLGAVLAPTDPVLAVEVTVHDAGDQDRMRYGLSGEAGVNDGAAFPFVIFALMWMEQPARRDIRHLDLYEKAVIRRKERKAARLSSTPRPAG